MHSFDVKTALQKYQDTLVPLQYHELWFEIVHDYVNVETTLEKRTTTMKLADIIDKTTLDEEDETALVFGTNQVIYGKSEKFFRQDSSEAFVLFQWTTSNA